MAAPTITWYAATGTTMTPSLISTLSYGNVQAGYWSSAEAVYATFSSSANTLKFWLNGTSATVNGTGVSVSSSNGWTHKYAISPNYQNPANVTTQMMAGSVVDGNGKTWASMPESEPASSNFQTTTVGNSGTGAGGNTDFIYLAANPPSNAADGLYTGWSFRLSFLYP